MRSRGCGRRVRWTPRKGHGRGRPLAGWVGGMLLYLGRPAERMFGKWVMVNEGEEVEEGCLLLGFL